MKQGVEKSFMVHSGKWAFLFFVLLFWSCKSGSQKEEINKKIEDDVLYENFIDVKTPEVTYKIPSPIELFLFLKKSGSNYMVESLHEAQNHLNYQSSDKKAINFGIYAADLTYCTVYGDQQATIIYFDAAKKLASDLGLVQGFGEKIAHRIDENLSNVDSLIDITTDSYYTAMSFLEEQGQGELLGLILIGGWVEGLYLTIESVNELEMTNPVIERVADQQLLLDNLLAFLENNFEHKNNQKYIELLKEVQEEFDELYFNDENTIITKNQFVDIANKVKEIRKKLTS